MRRILGREGEQRIIKETAKIRPRKIMLTQIIGRLRVVAWVGGGGGLGRMREEGRSCWVLIEKGEPRHE